MLKRFTGLFILICFVTTGCATRHVNAHFQSASPSSDKSKAIAKLKKRAVDLGVGSRVSVRLHSGEKLKGQILEITDEYMTLQLVSGGTVESRDLEFSTISEIRGRELSTGAKIAIGAGVGAAVTMAILLILIASLAD